MFTVMRYMKRMMNIEGIQEIRRRIQDCLQQIVMESFHDYLDAGNMMCFQMLMLEFVVFSCIYSLVVGILFNGCILVYAGVAGNNIPKFFLAQTFLG